jgi:hypothetical protein
MHTSILSLITRHIISEVYLSLTPGRVISLSSGASAEFVAVTDRNIRLIFRFTHLSSACMYVCPMYQPVFFSSTTTLM